MAEGRSEPTGILPDNPIAGYVQRKELPRINEMVQLRAPNGDIVTTTCLGWHSFGSYNGIEVVAPEYGPEYIKLIAGFIKARTIQKFDNIILMTGEERGGKSTLAQQIADEIEPGYPIDRIVFKIEDFERLIEELPRGSVIIFDEAGFDLFSQEWYESYQKRIIKKLTVLGERQLVIFLLLPHRMKLNAGLRERRVPFWINVNVVGDEKIRGFADFRRSKGNEWTEDAFWEGMAAFRFGPISGPRYSAYLQKKEEFNALVKSDQYPVDKEDKQSRAFAARDRAIYLLRTVGKMKQEDIAEELELSQSMISKTIRQERAKLSKEQET